MEDLEEKAQLEQSVEGAYLTHLLLSDQMTVTEILGSITELLLAGVDTVSTGSVHEGQSDDNVQWLKCWSSSLIEPKMYTTSNQDIKRAWN